MFKDRTEAGLLLAGALRDRVSTGALVVGVPRGGVVVAAEVARILGLELDVVVVRKLGAPGSPEYAIGAVDEEGVTIGGRAGLADDAYLARESALVREEINRRIHVYRGTRPPALLTAREVVLVDDGIATGMTLVAAVQSLRRRGAFRIIVAAPVAAPEAARALKELADDVVVLEQPPLFDAVGRFYREFGQTTDTEVIRLLDEAWSR